MPSNERSLVGSVVERKTPSSLTGTTSSRFAATPNTGFPAVQHRTKSAFARGREEAKGNSGARSNQVPSVGPLKPPETNSIPTSAEDLRRQISEENDKRVASMTPEEIEEGRQTILEQLGSGANDLFRRVHEAKLRKLAQEAAIRDADKETPTEKVCNSDSTNGQPFIIAQPKPTLPPLGARTGILRVKSLENIPQTGKAFEFNVFFSILTRNYQHYHQYW